MLAGPPLREPVGPQDHRQRAPGARRPRLHPRPSRRALAAQRSRLRHLRRPGDRLGGSMIDFELSDGLKNMQQLTHQAAEMAMRPIAREYDEREHEKPWDFLNMMWEVSHANPIGGAGDRQAQEALPGRKPRQRGPLEGVPPGAAGPSLSLPHSRLARGGGG